MKNSFDKILFGYVKPSNLKTQNIETKKQEQTLFLTIVINTILNNLFKEAKL